MARLKCCDLTAGMLRTPVTIERLTRTPDGSGGFTEAWAAIMHPRVHLEPLSGTERQEADRRVATVRVRAYMRWTANIKESDRLVYGDTVHNILAALNLETRNLWLQLDLERGIAT